MSRKYAIIDIETTGGLLKRDKITEIAIVVHDGHQVVDTFQSLVNPGRSIPTHISRLTGLTDEMLVDAPKFYEIARQIVELTEDCIFVAHNVRFDYSFIKRAFESLGYTYTRKQLCTVRLSRMLNPDLQRHGLDALCSHYEIVMSGRHRAFEDAMATAQVFELMLKRQSGYESIEEIINYGIKASRLPAAITLEKLHALPETCGVYYLHNQFGEVIYVGKSINIKKRIMQHFAENTAKASKLQQRVHDISFEETGSELVALLLEQEEIKRLQPEINRSLRSKLFPFALYYFIDNDGYINIKAEKLKKNIPPGYTIIKEYPKLKYAKGHLDGLVEEFDLCQHLCGDKTGVGACFYTRIGKCLGACTGQESVDTYNQRVREAIEYLQRTIDDNFFVIDQGREISEKSVILVEDGQVQGYGYMHEGTVINCRQRVKDIINPLAPNRDAQRIMYWYLKEKRMEKVVHFSS